MQTTFTNTLQILFITIILTLISGCGMVSPQPDIKNTKTYERAGAQFQYPSNWNVKSDKQYTETRITTIDSAGYGGTMIYISPKKLDDSLEVFAHKFIEGIPINKDDTGTYSKSVFTALENQDGYIRLKSENYFQDDKLKMHFSRIFMYKVIDGIHVYVVNHTPSKYLNSEKIGFKLITSTLIFP